MPTARLLAAVLVLCGVVSAPLHAQRPIKVFISVDTHTVRYRAATIADVSRFISFATGYRANLAP